MDNCDEQWVGSLLWRPYFSNEHRSIIPGYQIVFYQTIGGGL